MTGRCTYGPALLVLVAALLLPGMASAHHGWSWTTGENRELTGRIESASLGNPHGELVLDVDGERWTVEVGQPWRHERAGLTDEHFAPGNEIRVSGEASAQSGERLLKVERLWIDGRKYELYPNRD